MTICNFNSDEKVTVTNAPIYNLDEFVKQRKVEGRLEAQLRFHLVTALLKNWIVTIIIKVIKFSFSKCHKVIIGGGFCFTWIFPCIASLGYLQREENSVIPSQVMHFCILLYSFGGGRNGRPPNIATFPENLFQVFDSILAKHLARVGFFCFTKVTFKLCTFGTFLSKRTFLKRSSTNDD